MVVCPWHFLHLPVSKCSFLWRLKNKNNYKINNSKNNNNNNNNKKLIKTNAAFQLEFKAITRSKLEWEATEEIKQVSHSKRNESESEKASCFVLSLFLVRYYIWKCQIKNHFLFPLTNYKNHSNLSHDLERRPKWGKTVGYSQAWS